MSSEELFVEAERATGLLKGRFVSRLIRPSARKVALEFDDGVRLFVDSSRSVKVSVSPGPNTEAKADRRALPDSADNVPIELTKSEALVLFELLSRFTNSDEMAVHQVAEERVLWNLCAPLERMLVDPFEPDWSQLLDSARGERLVVSTRSNLGVQRSARASVRRDSSTTSRAR